MTTLLHVTHNCTIEYDQSVPCIIDNINGFLLSEEFRMHLEKGLELAIEKKKINGKIGWLGNTQCASGFSADDLDWLTHNWLPRAADAGIKYMATIFPEDQVAQFTADIVTEEFDSASTTTSIEIRYFSDVHSAKEWLSKSLHQ